MFPVPELRKVTHAGAWQWFRLWPVRNLIYARSHPVEQRPCEPVAFRLALAGVLVVNDYSGHGRACEPRHAADDTGVAWMTLARIQPGQVQRPESARYKAERGTILTVNG